MGEEEIVRLFLDNGFQISKNALDLAYENPEIIISHLKKMKNRPFIITEKHIKEILKTISNKPIDTKMIKEYKTKKEPTRVDDYVKEFLSRYERIKSLLIKQMAPKKLVSINKIGLKTTNFSLIGVVREKNEGSLLIEDPTGEMNLYVDKSIIDECKKIILDDIIGVQCKKVNEKYYAEKIFYPDITSSREINKTKDELQIAIIQTSPETTEQNKKILNKLSDVKNLSTLFLFSPAENMIKNNISPRFNLIQIFPNSTPKLFQLDEIKILTLPKPFFDGLSEFLAAPEIVLSFLKRRELIIQHTENPHIRESFILDDIPDIVISNFDGSFHQNYKGTTIISNSDSKKIFIVNLKTREVSELSV